MDLGGAKRSRSPSAASPAILKVNCPEGAREGGLGHWFLSHRWERNSPRRAKPCETARRVVAPYKGRKSAPSSGPFGATFPPKVKA